MSETDIFFSPVEDDFAVNGKTDLQSFQEAGFEKQEVFDRFLTYKRRMARLGATQAIYLYDMRMLERISENDNNLFGGKNEKPVDAVGLCQEIIEFYKDVFFSPSEYGWNKKNKKIDEDFMFALIDNTINYLPDIDKFIQKHLSGNWTVIKLDFVLRSIIRCAIAEMLLGVKIEKAVICSEYTNIASNFFNGKEIGFINGIIDKLYSSVLLAHPFISRKNI